MSDDVLTANEAAHALKVSVEVVTALLTEGELPGRQIDGEWRTTLRALVSYVDGVPLVVNCCVPGEAGSLAAANCCAPGDDNCC